MAFGRKAGSLKKLKETLAKGGGSSFIKYVPKNGSMNVRFITEPEEWVSYMEHYDTVLRASYPCSGETDCPGCQSGERKSSRYLSNAVNLDEQDRVIPLQLPKDLANRLVIKYEKWGSLTDRDIELTRQGEGLDTTYDMDPGAVDRKSITKYVTIDLLKVLEDSYNNVFGDKDEDEEDEKPVTRGRAKSAAATRTRAVKKEEPEDDDDEGLEDEEEAPKTRARPAAAALRRIKPEPEKDDDDDDDDEPEDKPVRTSTRRAAKKPEPEPEPEDEEYDEDDLKAMTLGQVRAVARELDLETKGKSKDDLIDEILDSEPPF